MALTGGPAFRRGRRLGRGAGRGPRLLGGCQISFTHTGNSRPSPAESARSPVEWCVPVVTTGMHPARMLAGVVQPGLLHHGQRIDVCPQSEAGLGGIAKRHQGGGGGCGDAAVKGMPARVNSSRIRAAVKCSWSNSSGWRVGGGAGRRPAAARNSRQLQDSSSISLDDARRAVVVHCVIPAAAWPGKNIPWRQNSPRGARRLTRANHQRDWRRFMSCPGIPQPSPPGGCQT